MATITNIESTAYSATFTDTTYYFVKVTYREGGSFWGYVSEEHNIFEVTDYYCEPENFSRAHETMLDTWVHMSVEREEQIKEFNNDRIPRGPKGG